MSLQYAQYTRGVLRPHSEITAEAWSKMSNLEVVQVKIKRSRNEKFNSLYHALLGYVSKALDASGENMTADDIHKEIKVRLGYYKIRKMPDHIARITGRDHELEFISTSFDSMSEETFREFVTKAVGMIETEICPYLMESDYAQKVSNIIAEFRK